MADLSYAETLREAAYSDALTLVAAGEEREATRTHLLDAFPSIESSEISDILDEALTDAERQGVEREDIDPSWF